MYFGILGSLEVVDEGRTIELSSARQRALLALLILQPRTVRSTESIVGALWPDSAGSGALRFHLSKLRNALEPDRPKGSDGSVILTRDPGYVLDVDPSTIDAQRFEQLARQGRALVDDDPAAASEHLREALGLWRGPALAEFADEPFARSAAVRLEELRLDATEDLVRADLALGRHTELVPRLYTLVGEHPLREQLWAHLMVALFRSGRQAEALRAYQRLRRHLSDELGLSPSTELRDLESRILDQDPTLQWQPRPRAAAAAPTAHPLPPTLAAAATSSLVGRDTELQRLRTAWAEATDGVRRMVVLSGEPGIGKTRLAAALAEEVHRAGGARVLYGRCDEGLVVPYQPIVDALAATVERADDDELAVLCGARPSELARLVPEIARRLPDVSVAAGLDGESDRYRLFDAVTRWLAVTAELAPTLVVVDDLQWMGRPLAMMLRHVVRELRSARVLVVATCRDTEHGDEVVLDELLADLRRVEGVERIRVEGLGLDEITQLMEDAGVEDPALADAIATETDGNPFFVREYVAHLTEGALVGRELAVPESARDIVRQRLSRLDPTTVGLLTAAAVLGAEFEPAIAAATASISELDVLDALEEATAAGVLDELDVVPLRYRFSHLIVRSTLLDGLSGARRIALHRRAAEAIEQSGLLEAGVRGLDELAHHRHGAAASGMPADVRAALDAAKGAADGLLLGAASEPAATWYRRALELHAALGRSGDPWERYALLIAAGEAELRAGLQGHRRLFLEAADLAVELGEPQRQARPLLASSRGFFSETRGVDQELIGALEHALRATGTEATATRAELLATLASELVWAPDGDRRFDLSDEALRIARSLGDRPTIDRVLSLRNVTITAPDTLAQRLEDNEELLASALERGDAALQFRAAFNMAGAALEAGDAARLQEVLDLAVVLSHELDQPALRWQISFVLASNELMAGDLVAAERLALHAQEIGESIGHVRDARIFAFEQINELRRLQDRLDEQASLIEVGLESGLDTALILARQAWWLGREDLAAAAFARATANGPLPPRRDPLAGPALANLSFLAARLGAVDVATELIAMLTPLSSTFLHGIVSYPSASHHLGVLSAVVGAHDEADKWFAIAEELHEGLGAPLLVAETRLEWARAVATRSVGGDDDRVVELMEQVRSTAARTGARRLLREAEALTGSRGVGR